MPKSPEALLNSFPSSLLRRSSHLSTAQHCIMDRCIGGSSFYCAFPQLVKLMFANGMDGRGIAVRIGGFVRHCKGLELN